MKTALKSRRVLHGFLLILVTCLSQFAAAQQPYKLGNENASGSAPGEFYFPVEVDTDSSGKVYVADRNNHRIQIFNSDGEYLSQIGSGTASPVAGELNSPDDVAVDDAGNVYVADTGNIRIQMFDNTGAFVSSWGGSYGTNDNQFPSNPGAIAVDAQGNYVYVAAGHDIYKFAIVGEGDFEWIAQFGGYGGFYEEDRALLGNLWCSCSLAVDAAGNVYVAENGNKRIQKFDSDGNSLGVITGGTTPHTGQLIIPDSIAVDLSGNIYVADYGHSFNRFIKFDSNGTFIEITPAQFGLGNQQVNGIAVDDNDTVYIADGWNHTVKVFPGIEDMDSDGVADADDNCPMVANPDQTDSDGDLIGNACDDDDDNDNVLDSADNCPLIVNTDQLNTDGDSMGNACDPDADNDGIDNQYDQCPLIDGSGSTINDGCPDGVDGLILWLHGAVDTGGLRNSLGAKLEAARNARHPAVAEHQLKSFINQVSAQSGKKISAQDAATLINMANNVIRSL